MGTMLGFNEVWGDTVADSAEQRLNYETIKSPPGLFGFNGCGLRLYGSRDKDADTSSDVATRFMTLVFFPLFAIDAYRISKTDEGSYFLGKTPLSSLSRGWNYVLALALIA